MSYAEQNLANGGRHGVFVARPIVARIIILAVVEHERIGWHVALQARAFHGFRLLTRRTSLEPQAAHPGLREMARRHILQFARRRRAMLRVSVTFFRLVASFFALFLSFGFRFLGLCLGFYR